MTSVRGDRAAQPGSANCEALNGGPQAEAKVRQVVLNRQRLRQHDLFQECIWIDTTRQQLAVFFDQGDGWSDQRIQIENRDHLRIASNDGSCSGALKA